MRIRLKTNISPIAVLSLAIFMAAGRSADLRAFQSVASSTFTVGVMTGGIPPADMLIQHTPLVKGSPVSRQIIILGEAGADVPATPPAYAARLTTFSDFGPIENRKVRVRVLYRYVISLDPADTTGVPTVELPMIEGPDFTAFAFEIERSSVNIGFLQYRIIAERLMLNGLGALDPIGGVTFPPTSAADPEPFVSVGVQANASLVIGPEGGQLRLTDGNPTDGETLLDVPVGMVDAPTTFSIDEVPLNGFGGPLGLANPIVPGGLTDPIRVFRLDAGTSIRGLMRVSLLYPDFLYPVGQDGIIDGRSTPERNIVIMWWDGFKWRQLGGQVNPNANTITARVGVFGFLAIAAGSPLSPEDRRPAEKVITPNNDGVNDAITFSFGDLLDNVQVEIFDITGHRIKTVMSSSSLQWDGRDDSGSVVESGVYIYQYEIDGKRVSGVVAVAK